MQSSFTNSQASMQFGLFFFFNIFNYKTLQEWQVIKLEFTQEYIQLKQEYFEWEKKKELKYFFPVVFTFK